MKHLRIALASLLALAAAPVAAQQFPTVPAQTVIGRMGIPGDTGPSQAIPFTTFTQRLLSGGVLAGLALPSVNASNDLTFYDTSPMAAGQGGRIAFGGKINNTTGTLFEWAAIGAPKLNNTAGNTVGSLAFYVRGNSADKWGNPQVTISQPGMMTIATDGAKQLGIIDPTKLLIVDGSASAPVTSLGPTVLVSRYENQAFGAQNGAIYALSVGAATSTAQPVAMQAYAYNVGSGDVNGFSARAEQRGTGLNKAAIAGFTDALAFTSGSSAISFQYETTNNTGQDAPYFVNLAAHQVMTGLDINYDGGAGNNLGTMAIGVRSINGQWDVGLGFGRTGGVSPNRTADIQSDTDALSVLVANSGSHVDGINLTGISASYVGNAFISPGFSISGLGVASFGKVGGTTGTINMKGSTSGTISILAAAAAGTYNFNLPITAGSAGQVLTSQAGGSTAMTWTTPTTGTVTSIATTSPITGGTITSTGTIACATCVTSAASLTANSLMIGSGSQASAVTTTGTGVLTALGVNTGSAGAFVVNGGALGTPSSGSVATTLLTGTLAAAQEPAHTGDVTNSAGSLALSIAANAVTLAKLATQATNTVLGNATSGSAVPTALAVGTCSTASSALIWTTNTGFGCNTSINAATLGSATFAAPGAIGGGTPSTGAFTTLSASTSITSPLLIGGSGTTGTQQTFQTTTGNGTTDAFAFKGGNNGATTFATLQTGSFNIQSGSTYNINGTSVLSGSTLGSGVTASSLTSVGASLNIGGSSVTGRQLAVYGANQATFAFRDDAGTATFKTMGLLYDGKNQTSNAVLVIQVLGDTGTFVSNSGAWFRDGAFTTGSITYPGEAGSIRNEAQYYQPNITTSSAAQTGTVCWATGTGKFTVDTTVGCLTSIMGAKNITEQLDPAKALDIVSRLNPFAFRYKKGYGDSGRYEQFGFGAEEVALVDERLAGRDPEGALTGVRYQEMTAVLAGAIQKLKSEIAALRKSAGK